LNPERFISKSLDAKAMDFPYKAMRKTQVYGGGDKVEIIVCNHTYYQLVREFPYGQGWLEHGSTPENGNKIWPTLEEALEEARKTYNELPQELHPKQKFLLGRID